jgi:hypothetical protein
LIRACNFLLVVESRESDVVVVVVELSSREPMLLLVVVRLPEAWDTERSAALAVAGELLLL